ncbi:plasmid transfer protein [Mucilaginibacter sp. UYCu711]|uniref:plasmid transfer protein n=1 Tax=Mucilaginibacter sp. UYCu711 TaxID=3156339 RepID=UPI003D1E436A
MKRKLVLTLCLLLGLGVSLGFAQVNPSPDYKKSLQFLQGNDVYEEGMMTLLKGLKNGLWDSFSMFITDAKALSAIFMIIFFAIKSYEMMAGDKKMEIMPLLRPFGLVMVILWWRAFVYVVAFPADLIAAKTEDMYKTEQNNVNDLRFTRANYMLQVANSLYTFQAQTEVAAKESDTWYGRAWDSVSSTVKEGISTVVSPLLELKNRLTVGLQLLLTQLLELVGIWILRIAVYIIFMIQIIYSAILVILGPFAVAVSILPAFRDSFTTWIARFISVNLYSGIGYLVMYLSALIQKYALTSEISKYKELVGENGVGASIEKMTVFAGNGVLSFGTVIITFIVSAICMFTVPSISTWIVSTSGITSASSSFGRGAATMGGLARKAATGSFF